MKNYTVVIRAVDNVNLQAESEADAIARVKEMLSWNRLRMHAHWEPVEAEELG